MQLCIWFCHSQMTEATTPTNMAIFVCAGMIIINEVNLPPEKKTVKPADLGGVAGGTKFIVANILFKAKCSVFLVDILTIRWNDGKVEHELKKIAPGEFFPLTYPDPIC